MTKPLYPIRDNVLGFEPYTPGLSIEEIRERFKLSQVIKMASNENPLGTSPLVQERIKKSAANAFRYAPSGTPRLIKAIAAHLGVDEKNLVAGNGSDEIIDLLMRVCPTPNEHNVVACEPSFSMYRLQAKLCGVEFRSVPLMPDFSFDWQGLRDAIDPRTALVFLTTPDNPSGYCPTREQVVAFAQSLPSTCLLVMDEAYIDFCDPQNPEYASVMPLLASLPNMVVLRTFSKIAGLAGLRLGYGVMPAALASALRAVKPPFSVNILAEEAGIAVLDDTAFIEATRQAVLTGRAFISAELTRLGCTVLPTQANFIMFSLPENTPLTAKQAFEKLLCMGIIIRPLSSYNLAGYLRVSIGSEPENAAFIKALAEVLHHA